MVKISSSRFPGSNIKEFLYNSLKLASFLILSICNGVCKIFIFFTFVYQTIYKHFVYFVKYYCLCLCICVCCLRWCTLHMSNRVYNVELRTILRNRRVCVKVCMRIWCLVAEEQVPTNNIFATKLFSLLARSHIFPLNHKFLTNVLFIFRHCEFAIMSIVLQKYKTHKPRSKILSKNETLFAQDLFTWTPSD